jgi:hypothetical protein
VADVLPTHIREIITNHTPPATNAGHQHRTEQRS